MDPSWERLYPDLALTIENNQRRGDFLMTVGRNTSEDSLIAETLSKYLTDYTVNHLKVRNIFPYHQILDSILGEGLFLPAAREGPAL